MKGRPPRTEAPDPNAKKTRRDPSPPSIPIRLPHSHNPNLRQVRLTGRLGDIINVAPDSAHIPIDTYIPPLIHSSGARLQNNSRRFKPPYLTIGLAKNFDIKIDDPYITTRSVELFGCPWASTWVAKLPVVPAITVLYDRVGGFLRALPWNSMHVAPFRDAAIAEHQTAMQSPLLKAEKEMQEMYEDDPVGTILYYAHLASLNMTRSRVYTEAPNGRKIVQIHI